MSFTLSKTITLFAIYSAYFLTFALAGGGKFMDGKVPDWFTNQFKKSFLVTFPGIPTCYWTIAVLEMTVPTLLLVSLFKGECISGPPDFLSLAVAVASVIFVILGFGQRLVNDFVGAANSFFYFGVTLVTQLYLFR